MRGVARRLALAPAPLIVENGSAVWFPEAWAAQSTDWLDRQAVPFEGGRLLVLGVAAESLRPKLPAIAAAAGVQVRGFSRMTDEEVADRTGLSLEVATLARQRQFSEPFVCESGAADLGALDAAARGAGARVTRGGRFFHLTGPTDKGEAVRVVRSTCQPGTRVLGLGDAPNDLSLLLACDDAAIIPQPAGGLHPDLVQALPAARHAAETGPAGWNAVVLDWLASTTPQR